MNLILAIIVGVFVIGFLLYSLYRRSAKISLLNNLENSVKLVKFGLFIRLTDQLRKSYDLERAKRISAAMINKALSANHQPRDQSEKEFLKNNHDDIEKELKGLEANRELCNIITQTVRTICIIRFADGDRKSSSIYDPISIIKQYGIFISNLPALPPNDFANFAYEFYMSAAENSETYGKGYSTI